MPVSLSFGREIKYINYQINESRVARMMNSDRVAATHMGLWDKFKDLFRAEKKEKALNELYDCVHVRNGLSKLWAFEKLKSFSEEAYKDTFNTEIVQSSIACSIGQHRVCDIKLSEIMNIEEDVAMKITQTEPKMSTNEERLFISMVKKAAEITAGIGVLELEIEDLNPNPKPEPELTNQSIRTKLAEALGDEVYNLYRPGDNNRGKSPIEFRRIAEYSPTPEIKNLNAGAFNPSTQFMKIGISMNDDKMKLTMVHPAISFMLGVYTGPYNPVGNQLNGFYCDVNSGSMRVFLEDYKSYHKNKEAIDGEIRKILLAHEGNIYITVNGANRNGLF